MGQADRMRHGVVHAGAVMQVGPVLFDPSSKDRDKIRWGKVLSLHGRPSTIIAGLPANMNEEKSAIERLADEHGIKVDLQGEFERAILNEVSRFKADQLINRLPNSPAREYLPRESIVDYLRSPDGFGPWVEAGTLTRPLLREMSPKAYTALANWLRTNKLPADLSVPNRSQVIDREIGPSEKRAMSVGHTLRSRAYRSHKQPKA